jgi:glucoamylase
MRYSLDNWATSHDADAVATELSIHYSDLRMAPEQTAAPRFTFFWTDTRKWNGSDYAVAIVPEP